MSSSMSREGRLVLLDFDGTLTTKDTFLEFIKFYHGKVKFYFGIAVLSPVLLAYRIKLLSNWRAKEIVLTWYFKGVTIDHFNKKCVSFSTIIIPALLRPKGVETVKNYQLNSDVVIVSASAENWVAPWCLANNLDCIATMLEVKDNKLTGKIKEKNCFGPEKVNRIKKKYDLSKYVDIIAYGDSSGDDEMLKLAKKAFYKAF